MRPLKLELTYFGPYRHVLVDFTKFNSQPLFLISGKTGSGKTTLFDGMCYALFNQTTNDQRDAASLRSDFAPKTAESAVKLTFEHEGIKYQITRKPAQQVLGRGHKLVNHVAHVELLYPADSDQPKSITKISVADNFIKNLLHLDKEQFRQIALLPQGKFRQFLSSSSSDKAAILGSLFNTKLYQRWTQILKDQLAAQEKGQEQLQTQLNTLMQSEHDVDSNLPHTEWAAAVKARIDQQEEQQAKLVQAVEEQEKREAKANAQLQAASVLKDQQTELTQVNAHLATLKGQSQAITKATQTIHRLEWFNARQKDYFAYQNGQQRLQELQKQLQTAQQKLTETTQQQGQAQKALDQLQSQKATIDDLKTQASVLTNQLPTYEQQDRLKTQLTKQKQEVAAQKDSFEKDQQALSQIKEQLTKIAQQLAQFHDLEDDRVQLVNSQHQLADTDRLWQQLQDVQRDQETKQQELKEVQQQLVAANQQLKASKKEYEDLQDRRTRNQIAALVAKLHDNQACPVCGSLDHPHPADVEKGQQVTDEELDHANETYVMAGKQQARLQSQQHQLTTAVQANEQQLGDLGTQLRTTLKMQDQAADFSATLKEKHSQLNELSAQLQGQQKLKEQLEKQQQTDTAKQQELQRNLDQAQKNLNDLQLQLTQTQSTFANQTKHLQYPDLKQAQAALKQLQKQVTVYDQKVSQVTEQLNDLQQTVSAYQGQVEQGQKEQADLQSTQSKRHSQLTDILAEADFNCDWSFWQWAQDNNGQLKSLQQQVENYQLELGKTQAQAAKLKQAIGDRGPVDLAPLKQAATAAHQQLAQLQEQSGSLKQAIAQHKANLKQVQELLQKQEQAFTKLAEFKTLVSVVDGNTDSHLSLERYVLRSYFDEVLQAANPRLQELSNGRYLFALSDESQGRGAKWTGLEVNVYDDNAGRYRSARTLSGGESFIASLALALALSDVVQQHQGGVHIDALFVDEGFGSLDADALQQALQALQTIHGGRMVGIISHVAALEEQIPNQLQVETDHGVSTVKYQLEEL